MNADRFVLVVFAAALVGTTVLSVSTLVEKNQRITALEAQVGDLQQEIFNWRESAVPALNAVGVKVDRQRDGHYGDEVGYWALRNALNPCFNSRTDWSLCKKYWGRENEIPIQISIRP